jgi:hypothetical protein
MTIEEFKSSLKNNEPPDGLTPLLKALWYDANGDWKNAHETAQEISTYDGSWVHAYLHRKEGDLSNASYWYLRAGRIMPDMSLEIEWEKILTELLGR